MLHGYMGVSIRIVLPSFVELVASPRPVVELGWVNPLPGLTIRIAVAEFEDVAGLASDVLATRVSFGLAALRLAWGATHRAEPFIRLCSGSVSVVTNGNATKSHLVT